MTVARITVVKRSSRRAFTAGSSGIAARIARATAVPSRSRKNSRYIAMQNETTRSSASWPKSTARPASAWPRCVIAAVRRVCSTARSSSPSRSSSPVAHAGSAAIICAKYAPKSIWPLRTRWTTPVTSCTSEIATSASGRMTISRMMASVASAAAVGRPPKRPSSLR